MAEELSQAELDAQRKAEDEARRLADIEREERKETRRTRLEVIRLAKETLIENSRYKNIDERDVSAEDITNFANTLFEYTNQ